MTLEPIEQFEPIITFFSIIVLWPIRQFFPIITFLPIKIFLPCFTFLLKGVFKISLAVSSKSSTIDLYIRNYLSKFKIYYSHGTGHGVGNFGDVHEKYPIISSRSQDILTNNNLFSIEPGYYLEGQFGLRLENLSRDITRKFTDFYNQD